MLHHRLMVFGEVLPVQDVDFTQESMSLSSSTPLTCPQLPLAVYKEVQAHLQQITGVTVNFLPPLPAPFDYQASQIGGITVEQTTPLTPADRARLEEILAYYGQQFGAWQPYGETTP